jgi:hypothetical protein
MSDGENRRNEETGGQDKRDGEYKIDRQGETQVRGKTGRRREGEEGNGRKGFSRKGGTGWHKEGEGIGRKGCGNMYIRGHQKDINPLSHTPFHGISYILPYSFPDSPKHFIHIPLPTIGISEVLPYLSLFSPSSFIHPLAFLPLVFHTYSPSIPLRIS